MLLYQSASITQKGPLYQFRQKVELAAWTATLLQTNWVVKSQVIAKVFQQTKKVSIANRDHSRGAFEKD